MPRKSRQQSPTGVYHVMLRGINHNDIFLSDIDRRKFLKILNSVVAPTNGQEEPLPPYCHIHAYCLMDNHVHLLISEGSDDIGTVMKRIGVAYVNYFNKQHERMGPLFQDRFRSEPVCNTKYFVQLLRYIHFNPIEAHIAQSLDEWRWSSWSEYTQNNKTERICSHELPFCDLNWEDICELVQEYCHPGISKTPLDRNSMTDREALAALHELCENEPFNTLPTDQRKKVILEALSMGMKKNQIARLLGIGYSTISYHQKMAKKNRFLCLYANFFAIIFSSSYIIVAVCCFLFHSWFGS